MPRHMSVGQRSYQTYAPPVEDYRKKLGNNDFEGKTR